MLWVAMAMLAWDTEMVYAVLRRGTKEESSRMEWNGF
jgi:hypothetical protein